MKTSELMIRCLAMREGDQWVAICLPFDLAAQADSLPAVRQKLDSQIKHYLHQALVGQDREHAQHLLNRRAPLKYYLMYYLVAALGWMRKSSRCKKIDMPVPLAPAY